MILNVPERLTVLSILPKEGSYATLKILRELRMNLSFTEDELKDWGIITDYEKGVINWEDNSEAEIPIGEKAMGIIVDELGDLEKKGKLQEGMIDIYEKFIPTT